eukprot:10177452-Ditylum_brightwellii.AAC.1
MGVGGEEIQQFLRLIDLLHGKNFSKNALSRVEVDVGAALQDVTVSSMKRAIATEIKATAGPKPLTYEKWLEIPEKECLK